MCACVWNNGYWCMKTDLTCRVLTLYAAVYVSFHCNAFTKGIHLSFFHLALAKIVGQTSLCSFVMAAVLKEGKTLNSKPEASYLEEYVAQWCTIVPLSV